MDKLVEGDIAPRSTVYFMFIIKNMKSAQFQWLRTGKARDWFAAARPPARVCTPLTGPLDLSQSKYLSLCLRHLRTVRTVVC